MRRLTHKSIEKIRLFINNLGINDFCIFWCWSRCSSISGEEGAPLSPSSPQSHPHRALIRSAAHGDTEPVPLSLSFILWSRERVQLRPPLNEPPQSPASGAGLNAFLTLMFIKVYFTELLNVLHNVRRQPRSPLQHRCSCPAERPLLPKTTFHPPQGLWRHQAPPTELYQPDRGRMDWCTEYFDEVC